VGVPQSVTLVFGSCQHDDFAEPQPIWDEIAGLHPDAFCTIGDMPYIDSTDLAVQRRRYRELFSIPGLAALCASVPSYALWDDHDFGRNDTDGNLPGKERARRAFAEYHANAPTDHAPGGDGLGEGGKGTYSSFRAGAVEVFLIDARWFAGTEKTFAGAPNQDKPSLIGAQQWAWLKRGLKSSDAPFKLLVTGMVWNDDVRPGKKDYWGMYPYEREAVFDWLAENDISGVVLVGGDIHRNRAYRHGKAFSHLGYPLYEVVTSPFGSKVMKQGDGSKATVPDMIYDQPDARTFAAITVDSTKAPATLVVRWMNDVGKELFKVETTAAELTAGKRGVERGP
jgi:phosphodiesterase/alkaline phosphatase D-like protein